MLSPIVRGITLSALLAASLAPPARAAEKGAAAEALAPGSWSVQFSVLPDFTLGTYSGSNLSLKRHLASGNAVRFGVSLSFDGGSDDLTDASADTFSTQAQLSSDDLSLWTIGVNGYYLWYTDRASPVHAYWGAGPTISWGHRHDDRSQAQTIVNNGQPPSSAVVTDEITVRDWRVGGAATAGVEWLVARRIGLFAEYGSSLSYVSIVNKRHSLIVGTNVSTRIDDFETDSHHWQFSGGGGRLGVSVYY
jgi:opacity protein-like surface antigen